MAVRKQSGPMVSTVAGRLLSELQDIEANGYVMKYYLVTVDELKTLCGLRIRARAWETRRRRALERSERARRGWETRRANDIQWFELCGNCKTKGQKRAPRKRQTT